MTGSASYQISVPDPFRHRGRGPASATGKFRASDRRAATPISKDGGGMSERQAKRLRQLLNPRDREGLRELWPRLNHRQRGKVMRRLSAADPGEVLEVGR